MRVETSPKMEAQVLLHKFQGLFGDIACNGRRKSLKVFQDAGLLAETFKLSKNFTIKNSNVESLLGPRSTLKKEYKNPTNKEILCP